ncbi:MAG: type II toxin-antitoxin system VapC family toxin [Thermodesulfovibrionales bacterium]|nr:type II toxin-antitoxin system VapC family toxin [Nitrospinota bacterium]MCG2813182.1 type II toxin-antitoxin system VapC family toxin [Thermodesulfovibrionales bacterium]MDP3049694.1 type II toxin-antitoxin system VapC family toxin [Thermodesulfovibrionales bacterium]
MNGKYLLDTNIIISIFAKDPQIHNRLANAEEVFVPCIAIGELCFGAYKSLKIEENLARIDEFALSNTVLPCDIETAKKYGDIKNRLKEKGQPIPENDIWIAAIAQQYALTVVTKDLHFESIEDLKIELW